MCHMLGGGTGRRNRSSEGLRLSSMAAQLGYGGATRERCSNEQSYKDLSEGGFAENPKLPVLKEKPHSVCVCGVRGKGPGNFSWRLPRI